MDKNLTIDGIAALEPGLKEEFFMRDTVTVAKELIGKILVRETGAGTIAGRIVETEAYLHENDLASHSAPGLTKRNAPMFEPGGFLYVYKIYGIHHCINLVTGEKNHGAAVLLRAVEPLAGIDLMKKNRGVERIEQLCKGPGNLAKAFAFDRSHNLLKVGGKELKIIDDGFACEIAESKRIGIKKSDHLTLRFYMKHSIFVSGKKL